MIATIDFNSIKVRLKLSKAIPAHGFELFQFHKGTIKTIATKPITYQIVIFQFHKGTIKTPNTNATSSNICVISIP